MQIFSIRDSKSEAYLQPFFSPNVATAMRALESAVADESHQFHQHVEDYALFQLGTFDENTGTIDAQPHPTVVCNLIDLTRTAPPALHEAAS